MHANVTQATSSGVTEREQAAGTRARARSRPLRCERTKAEDGARCRRLAGANTDHEGEGPCSLHDDGTWEARDFATDLEAQEAFIAAVAADRTQGTRKLIEPLGYHRRDVVALEAEDEEFRLRVEEARGWDPESLRREWWRRAVECESDRLLELAVKTKLPEGAVLRQSRIDGQLDVRGVPFVDYSKLSPDELADLRRLLEKGSPASEELPREGRPALELLEGGTT